MNSYPHLYQDLIKRITRLEDHLFNGGKGMVYKLSRLENVVLNNKKEVETVNDLENRIILIEERISRQAENLRLRDLSMFLSAFPYGWKGLFIVWILCTATISQLVEIADLSKIVANFLGAK